MKRLTDEELIKKSNQGDEEALNFIISKYTDIVELKVNKYFMIGGEKEDIFQEGLIGLFKAVKSFDPEKENSFKTFASLCIERQIITAIKASTRQKQIPLNNYVSLDEKPYEDNEEITMMDMLDLGEVEDPLDTVAKKEYLEAVEEAINNNLSDFERDVLERFVEGDSYQEIAESLNINVKSVDNAIQRIRKKATKNIEK